MHKAIPKGERELHEMNCDVVEFGDFTVVDYLNGMLIIRHRGGLKVRISDWGGDGMVVSATPGMTLEPTAVNGVPAFRVVRKA
jgi:hypothetical protein